MHSLVSPSDKRANRIPRTSMVFSDEEVSILNEKLNKDVRELQVDKYYADPNIYGQNICLVSFIPSSDAKPDKDGIYGMMKVRGVYATDEEANERAEFIIRNVDSYHEIFHANVGRPFPVTESNDFANTVKSIDIRKKTTELISEDILNKKREEKEEMMGMQEREKKLLDESEKAQKGEKMDVFDEYITMNVKRAQLLWTYKETMDKINQMKGSYEEAVNRIKELDDEHPEYKDQYKEKYMEARRQAGIPDEQNSFVEYMALDINTKWDGFYEIISTKKEVVEENTELERSETVNEENTELERSETVNEENTELERSETVDTK
jgi:hypothetical protein